MSEQAKGEVAKYLMSVATLAVIIIVGLVIVKSFAIQGRGATEIAKTNTTTKTAKTNAKTTASSSDKTKKIANKTTSTNAKNIKNIAPAAAPTTTATTANPSTTAAASSVTATGPRETLMTLIASAALTFAGVSYVRSRQALKQRRG